MGAHGAAARRHGVEAPFDLDDLDAAAARAEAPDTPPCDHPGCTEAGAYRAPKDRSLSSYYNFCLCHVREYNKAWNYCADMNQDEIEQHVRRSTVWDRPTWRMGGGNGAGGAAGHGPGSRRFETGTVHDPFGVFDGLGAGPDGQADSEPAPFPRDSRETRALQELDLTWPLTREDLRARYRTLVKRHHPDANNGDKGAEERFKRVNEAYRVLLATVEG